MGRKKIFNKYDLSGQYGVGFTTNTKSRFYFDKEDYDLIKNYSWNEHILQNGYHALEAWSSERKSIVRMSWIICGKWYDHINHNPLDNRKENLRAATQIQNIYNRSKQRTNKSGVIGVYWMKDRNKWRAQLRKDGKIMMSAQFESFDEAVSERLKAEQKYFGEFSPQLQGVTV